MCFAPKNKTTKLGGAPDEPEQAPDPLDPNAARKTDNEEVYGGQEANLRIDRSAAGGGVTAGTGLRMS